MQRKSLRASLPADSGPQNPPEYTVPAEANASIMHSESILGDIGFHMHKKKPEAPAHVNNGTLSSGASDSEYGGFEALIEPSKWLHPELSTGMLVHRIRGHCIWLAKGPAVDAFEKMKPEIFGFLEKHRGTIFNLLCYVYMIGRTEYKARPIIMFHCTDKDRRKDLKVIRDAFQKSGILDRYPGFVTGHSPRPLLFPKDLYYSQALSSDGKSTIGTSSLATSGDQTVSDSLSLLGNAMDENPASDELHEAEHTFEQTSIPSTDISGEPPFSPDETHRTSEEIVPTLTRLNKWITDKLWPTPDGLQRIWYLCVGLIVIPQSKSD